MFLKYIFFSENNIFFQIGLTYKRVSPLFLSKNLFLKCLKMKDKRLYDT